MEIARDFIFDPSLVLYLPLYELEGVSLMSKDARGHLCTVTGAVWRPNGKYFDGTDDRIEIPDHSSLDITSAITIEAWLKTSDTGGGIVLKDEVTAGTRSYSMTVSSSKLSFQTIIGGATSQTLLGNTLIDDDVWHCLCATYDGSFQRVYVDGEEDAFRECTGAIDVGTAQVRLGMRWRGYWDMPLGGLVGEARIYSRCLTPQEIQRNYQATKWRYR